MTKTERKNWIINIENCAEYVASRMGVAEVDWILGMHGARSIEELAPSEYEAVFSEFHQREADLLADEEDE